MDQEKMMTIARSEKFEKILSNENLMQRIKNKAFRYSPRFYEDLIQEALLKIARKIDTIDFNSSPDQIESFLYRTAKNAMTDFLRISYSVLSGRLDAAEQKTAKDDTLKKSIIARESTKFFSEIEDAMNSGDSEGYISLAFADPKSIVEPEITDETQQKINEILSFANGLSPIERLIFWQVWVHRGKLKVLHRKIISVQYPAIEYKNLWNRKKRLEPRVAEFIVQMRLKYTNVKISS